MIHIMTCNLNGIRSAAKKGFFAWLATQPFDLVAVQELRAQEAELAPAMRQVGALRGWFHCAERKGYAGVGIYSRFEPNAVTVGLGDTEFDAEGRYLALEFPRLTFVSLYLPSGSSGPERQAAKFRFMARFLPHLRALARAGKPVVIAGDFNIAHTPKDLKNWRSNQKNSGFLPEERAWLGEVLASGWVDVYRALYPDAEAEGYTWWSNRGQAWAKNVGWRIDYQLATPEVAASARKAWVYKEQRFSDHAPLVVRYEWTVA